MWTVSKQATTGPRFADGWTSPAELASSAVYVGNIAGYRLFRLALSLSVSVSCQARPAASRLKDWSENGASLTAYILARVHGLAEREGREEGEREGERREGKERIH